MSHVDWFVGWIVGIPLVAGVIAEVARRLDDEDEIDPDSWWPAFAIGLLWPMVMCLLVIAIPGFAVVLIGRLIGKGIVKIIDRFDPPDRDLIPEAWTVKHRLRRDDVP